MGKFILTQNSFAHGEVSPEFFARGDKAAIARGLTKLQNMDVLPSGGITRRPGTVSLFECAPNSILISFSVSDNENYLLVLSDGEINIYNDTLRVATLSHPWTADELKSVQYTQRFGTMIFVHPNHRPVILEKTSGANFELRDFEFAIASNNIAISYMPMVRFENTSDVKLRLLPSGVEDPIRERNAFATRDVWKPEDIGKQIFVRNQHWIVTRVVSPRSAILRTFKDMPRLSVYDYIRYNMTAPLLEWFEPAFSDTRGWPASITFHQNRLVFGGSRALPASIFMSKTGDHHNFDTGTGLDDEAIFLTLLSGTRQSICTVASSDSLHVLTNAGEWAITANPLTPSSINIRQHTNVGSRSDRYLPPQTIEGRTAFVARNGTQIRELVLDDLKLTYSAINLTKFSEHLMTDPTGVAYNNKLNRMFVPQSDGRMAVLTQIAPLEISAWAVYETCGEFKSVAVMNDDTYIVVERENKSFVEKFCTNAMMDADEYEFKHIASGTPLFAGDNAPKTVRLTHIKARVLNTKSLFFESDGRTVRARLPNEIYADNHPGFSGDIEEGFIGVKRDAIQPKWSIVGSEALPTTILSVTLRGRFTI